MRDFEVHKLRLANQEEATFDEIIPISLDLGLVLLYRLSDGRGLLKKLDLKAGAAVLSTTPIDGFPAQQNAMVVLSLASSANHHVASLLTYEWNGTVCIYALDAHAALSGKPSFSVMLVRTIKEVFTQSTIVTRIPWCFGVLFYSNRTSTWGALVLKSLSSNGANANDANEPDYELMVFANDDQVRDSYRFIAFVADVENTGNRLVCYSFDQQTIDVYHVEDDLSVVQFLHARSSLGWSHMFVIPEHCVLMYDGSSALSSMPLSSSHPHSSPAHNPSIRQNTKGGGSFEVIRIQPDGSVSFAELSAAAQKYAEEGSTFNRGCVLGKTLVTFSRKKIAFAAVGCGHRMRELVRLLRMRHDMDVQLVAVCDSNQDILQHSDEFRGVPRFSAIDVMLKFIPHIEWVLIGSINSEHAPHVSAALQAGKHVFCEKPLAHNWQACLSVVEAFHATQDPAHPGSPGTSGPSSPSSASPAALSPISRANSSGGLTAFKRQGAALFATGFVLRHAPFYVKLKELITSGKLGRITSVEANELLSPSHGGYIMRNWRRHRSQSGPHLLEKCCHDFDVLNWLIDSLPARVASFGGLSIFKPEHRPAFSEDVFRQTYCAWPHAWEDIDPFESDKDIEDAQVVILEYENGVKATFHSNSCSAFPQRRLVICGTLGTAEGDLIEGDLKFRSVDSYGAGNDPLLFKFGVRGMHGGGDGRIMDDLHWSMLSGQTPIASVGEGIRSAVVCLAIDNAMHQGQVVAVDEMWKAVAKWVSVPYGSLASSS
eukprot:ANDGO_04336.mRNA.1 Putative oxidoreductase YteT